MGRELAECPYCHGKHRTRKAFNACMKRHTKLHWKKDGSQYRK